MDIRITSSLCHSFVHNYETESIFSKNALLISYTFRAKSKMPGEVSLLLAVDRPPVWYQFLGHAVSKGYSTF